MLLLDLCGPKPYFFLNIYTHFIYFFVSDAAHSQLLISHQGNDSINCGHKIPCRTVDYTLTIRAQNNDLIMIDNQFSEKGLVFIINKSSPFKRNLTLMGVNGRPVVCSKRPIVLFEDSYSVKLMPAMLTVTSLFFKGVSLAEFTKAPNVTSIQILNCIISNLDVLPFIESHGLNSANISITIQNSSLFNFLTGINATGLNVRINASYSTLWSDGKYTMAKCTTFIKAKRVPSMTVDFSSLRIVNVVLMGSIKYEKMGNKFSFVRLSKASSVIRISNSIIQDTTHGLLFLDNATAFFTNCSFTNCTHNGLQMMVLQRMNAFFNNCSFRNNKNYMYGGIGMSRKQGDFSMAHFRHCDFVNNTGNKRGVGFILIGSNKAIFQSCLFINNSATLGGAIALSAIYSKFRECRFINNTASAGGAIYFGSKDGGMLKTALENCHFADNSAYFSLAYYDTAEGRNGQGGALMILSLQNARIFRCVFVGNKADIQGGDIMHEAGSLSVEHSTFKVLSDSRATKEVSCIYSSEICCTNVSIYDLHSFHTESLLLSALVLKQMGFTTTIKCFQGKSIRFDYVLKYTLNDYYNGSLYVLTDRFIEAKVTCSFCPENKYNASVGASIEFYNKQLMEYVYSTNYWITNIKCSECPFGGVCKRGDIHAADNFWGCKENDKIHFISCPLGYCCEGGLCRHYNSCASGRKGTLCGSCKAALTENLLTMDCLEPKNCLNPWYWVIVIFGGICYLVFFMYLNEIIGAFKILMPAINMEFKNRKNKMQPTVEPLLIAASIRRSEDEYAGSQNKQESKPDVFVPGLFKIVIFFYQINLLYKVRLVSEKSQSSLDLMLSMLKELLATAFNLRAEGTFYHKFRWCPIRNISPVLKVMLKMSFIIYVMLLILIIFIVFSIWRWGCRKSFTRSHEGKSATEHLLPCSLRLIIISYATITSSLFSLISCVTISSSKTVLFIDGNIECFQQWQYVVISIIVCWVVCFPFAIYTSSWLLHRQRMSCKMFLVSLTIPIVSVFYWLWIRLISLWKTSGTEFNRNSELQEEEINSEKQVLAEILDILEAPFRKKKAGTNNRDKGFKITWESTLIIRRLALIFVKSFVMDTVVKLLLMLLLTIVFLVHHVHVRPFATTTLNYMETWSLLMLTIICGLNIVPAYIYTFPLSVSPFSGNLIKTSRNIETALTLVFPMITGCCLLVLLTLRLLQLIIWLCKVIYRMTSHCWKPKSY